ncbi:biotin transporter BioY [Thermococcus sp.]|uniref:biotin transporter BioY n=1 Tax=Thermococcus sp. TaxID=35749 RepID=UPI002628153B|nr:biotin transporter BioY [Thermococcus sp.]
MNSREITFAALFASLTAVGAQISVPLGPVPFTFQVFFVLLSGLLLGARLGFLSQLTYVLVGALGFPVFAEFSGGFAHIYGPTGGYLLAFPIAALLAGYVTEKGGESVGGMTLGVLLGLAAIYILGWLRLGFYLGENFGKALEVGVLPFLPLDLLKGALAVGIARPVRRMGGF